MRRLVVCLVATAPGARLAASLAATSDAAPTIGDTVKFVTSRA